MDISRTRKQASFLNSIITKKKTGNYFEECQLALWARAVCSFLVITACLRYLFALDHLYFQLLSSLLRKKSIILLVTFKALPFLSQSWPSLLVRSDSCRRGRNSCGTGSFWGLVKSCCYSFAWCCEGGFPTVAWEVKFSAM